MTSVLLDCAHFKEYMAKVGPKIGRPDRPRSCLACDCLHIWFDGWRVIRVVILDDNEPHRFDEGLPLQRVVCSVCGLSWTLRPSFLYPHLSFQPDFSEASAVAYLSAPDATYQQVGKEMGCSARSVWRWVGWIGKLFSAPQLVAEAEQSCGGGQSVALIPRAVPQGHAKAYSEARDKLLLSAFQGLSALVVWARAQVAPPHDSSPLRFWLTSRFLTFREFYLQVGVIQSPPLPVEQRGPPGVNRRP
jgi:hypothetical protein